MTGINKEQQNVPDSNSTLDEKEIQTLKACSKIGQLRKLPSMGNMELTQTISNICGEAFLLNSFMTVTVII